LERSGPSKHGPREERRPNADEDIRKPSADCRREWSTEKAADCCANRPTHLSRGFITWGRGPGDVIGPRNHPFAAGPSADQRNGGQKNSKEGRLQQVALKQQSKRRSWLFVCTPRTQPFRRLG